MADMSRSVTVVRGVVLACCLTGAARAGDEALGVVIIPVADKDGALADNLTEVAMARLAETTGRRLVGVAELRRRGGADAGKRLHSCLEQPACLGSVGVSMGVSRRCR